MKLMHTLSKNYFYENSKNRVPCLWEFQASSHIVSIRTKIKLLN